MKYTFESVMHIGFTFSVNAGSYEEAVKKCSELKETKYYYDFPDLSMGEIELHLCSADEIDGDCEKWLGLIDEWV